MKILISAIACQPYGGSEGLLGWLSCQALASLGELWILVSAEGRHDIEQARANGIVPQNMHFIFVGKAKPYPENRLLARLESWRRYWVFSREILPIARELHEREHFDLVHHVTYSSYRVGNPLWRLGVPFIWGPISGTEVFPLWRFGHILSPSAKLFELARIVSGVVSRFSSGVRLCARNAFHIFAAHGEAVELLSKLRGTSEGISVLSYFSFSPEDMASIPRAAFKDRPDEPLKILAGGHLEGRKGLAIALEGLAIAKKMGTRFSFIITSSGPEHQHLQELSKRLGIEGDVSIGHRLSREDYLKELQDTDLYLLPSLREGGGLTMMEAMLAGCVPIVARCGGPGTAVTDECGVRVPVISPRQMAEEIAEAVVRFDQDRTLLQQMGTAAIRRIREDYAQGCFNPPIQAVYEAALATDKAKRG
jgi:glycosyltransferase involved in cell wall biosynthesis